MTTNTLWISLLYQENNVFITWRLWIIPIKYYPKKWKSREKFRQWMAEQENIVILKEPSIKIEKWSEKSWALENNFSVHKE